MKHLQFGGSVAEPGAKDKSIALFRLAFRPFFLLGSVFSIISIVLWAMTLNGHIEMAPYGGSYWWHTHEMLFGFVACIMCGFLLTAVQNWTKVPSIKGATLIGLVLLWLAARVLLLFPQLAPNLVIAIIDSLFLPLSALFLALPIIKVKLWRNLIFIPILLIMSMVNIDMHYQVYAAGDFQTASYVMVMLITLVMCIMGGRVFPMFTANGTQTERVNPIPILEKASILSVVLALIISLNMLSLPSEVKAGIYIFAGVVNFIRALRWRIWVTLKTPLVWSLHLSYWALAVGLIMLGLAEMTGWITQSQAIHSLTVGAMGLMILAMISRVSLGHTGRQIVVGAVMSLAFAIMFLTFVVRVFAPMMFNNYMGIIMVAAIGWGLSYSLFVLLYTPILTTPRVDGGSG